MLRSARGARVCDHHHMKQRARKRLAMRIARARSGERMQRSILRAYVSGSMSRATAMQALGLDWYGDLCDLVARAGLRVEVSANDQAAMDASLAALFPQGLAPYVDSAKRNEVERQWQETHGRDADAH